MAIPGQRQPSFQSGDTAWGGPATTRCRPPPPLSCTDGPAATAPAPYGGRESAVFPDRGRFMAYAARVMRGIVIDYRQPQARSAAESPRSVRAAMADPAADARTDAHQAGRAGHPHRRWPRCAQRSRQRRVRQPLRLLCEHWIHRRDPEEQHIQNSTGPHKQPVATAATATTGRARPGPNPADTVSNSGGGTTTTTPFATARFSINPTFDPGGRDRGGGRFAINPSFEP